MAGVGFELRRLFGNKGFFMNLRAYFVSTMITVGPTVICIILMTGGEWLLEYYRESELNRELFLATLTYAFAFSLIITGGYAMLTSRYIADCLFEKKIENIMPSLFGVCTVALATTFITGFTFLVNSPIERHIKIITYFIYAELTIIWIQSVYLSCVKYYLTIVTMFVIGGITMLLSVIVMIYTNVTTVFEAAIISVTLGFFVMVVSFFVILYRTFGIGEFTLKNCFEFLKAFDKYWELLLIGSLFFIGLFGQNFAFWFSKESIDIKDTYYLYPIYDLATFYSQLTILPAMVIFIVKVETAFYEKYRIYYQLVLGEGSIRDIKRGRQDMSSTLSAELRYIIEVQFFISFFVIVAGMRVLPLRGISMRTIDIFSMLTLGSLAYVILYLVTLLLLYYDDRRGALYVSVFFAVSSIGFSALSIYLGEVFYGDGFFLAALISMLLVLFRLRSYVNNIDFYTFGLQPIFIKENVGLFTKIYNIIVKLEERFG